MSVIVTTVGLLILSNVFMTFAWYAHLRNLSIARPAEDHSGDRRAGRLRAVCRALHASTFEVRLSLGCALPYRRSIFCVPST